MLATLNSIDTDLFLALNGLHSPFFDFIMYWVSDRLIWIPLYLFFAWLIIKHFGRKAWLWILLAGLAVLISDQTTVHLFKNVFLRPRPCHEPGLAGLVHLVNDRCGGNYGFISSHAANSFALATYLSFLLGKRIKNFPWLVLLWAAVVSYSRIYLGVHYPGDVIVGAIWGSGVGASVYIIARLFFKRTST